MRFDFNCLVGVIGSIACVLWGQDTLAIRVLMFFALADYILGVYSAFVNKEWSSKVGARGIAKKLIMLFIIIPMAFYIDKLLSANCVLFNVVVFWYIGNESISIIENSIKAGLNVPNKLKDAIQVLMNEEDNDDED
jgi:toxin secretion/phage lysis holin